MSKVPLQEYVLSRVGGLCDSIGLNGSLMYFQETSARYRALKPA